MTITLIFLIDITNRQILNPVISKKKPLICSAIPPQEAFHEIVELHERRSKNMKIVDMIQKINSEVQNPLRSEERKYCILDPKSALERVNQLISNSRSSINAMLDVWGLTIITQCKLSVLNAINNGIKIRIIASNRCIESENLFTLPGEVDLKIGDVFSNTIIIDTNNMISIDSSSGKAAVFTSIDIFGLSQLRNFEEKSENAIEIKYLNNTKPDIILKAIQLTKILERELLPSYIYAHTISTSNNNEDSSELLFSCVNMS